MLVNVMKWFSVADFKERGTSGCWQREGVDAV
jgi:hypothetical protein